MDNNTLKLLDAAKRRGSLRSWSLKLGLSGETLSRAKERGSVSPPIAYCLAEELGLKNAKDWALIAAAENERDSKCKQRMLKALGGNGGIRTARAVFALSHWDAHRKQQREQPSSRSHQRKERARRPCHRQKAGSAYQP